MSDMNTCSKCGSTLRPGSLVCMHCGRAVRPQPIALNTAEMATADKKSTIAIARFIAITVLIMNIVTIMICAGKPYTHQAYMWPAIICGAVSLMLVLFSLSMGKNEDTEELDKKADMVLKGAVGVLIFSGIEFFLAVGEFFFPMF